MANMPSCSLYIYTHILELEHTCTMGRDQRGVGPWPLPRIPTSCPISLLPIPLCGLPLRSDRGGWGGKDGSGDHCREVTGKCRPLPIPQKDDCSGDGKGAVVSWTTRPIFLYGALCMQSCNAAKATARAAKASKAEPRNGSIRPKIGKGQGVKAKRFWGVDAGRAYPHPTLSAIQRS